jgi:hypothetical protein
MKKEVKTLPKETVDIYKRYLNTPYFINKSKNKFLKNLNTGKATVEELETFLKENQIEINSKERFDFLKKNNVGVDCSGFVSRILDSISLQRNGVHIWKIVKRKTINPVKVIYSHRVRPVNAKMNADTITNNENTNEVKSLKDVIPSDLIRMNGGKHIAIISETLRENGVLKKIKYWHSTEGVGVCEGDIIIKDENKPLQYQEWKKIKGAEYQPLDLYKKRINSNSIRRLKLLK